MGARYYNPVQGRFLSPDPIGYPLQLDLYAYANNNPMGYHDPDGRCFSALYAKIKQSPGKLITATHRPFTKKEIVDNGNLISDFCYRKGYMNSTTLDVGRFTLDNSWVIGINGIRTSRWEAWEHATTMHERAGVVIVHFIHNASHGIFLDVVECILLRMGIETPATRMLREGLEWCANFIGPDDKIFLPCHSAGGSHAKLALTNSSQEVRDKVIALSIASAEIIPRELCFDAFNYASKRDFVTRTDIAGMSKYGDQLILLDPHPDAPFFDHGFNSPTFTEVIEYHTQEYIKKYWKDNK